MSFARAVVRGLMIPIAPWWLVVAIFSGTTGLFVLWSRTTYAREQQELLAWRQGAVAGLGMRTPITPYYPPALTQPHTLVEGAVDDVYVTSLVDKWWGRHFAAKRNFSETSIKTG